MGQLERHKLHAPIQTYTLLEQQLQDIYQFFRPKANIDPSFIEAACERVGKRLLAALPKEVAAIRFNNTSVDLLISRDQENPDEQEDRAIIDLWEVDELATELAKDIGLPRIPLFPEPPQEG